MAFKKAKAGKSAPPAASPDYSEALSLLSYGAELYDAFAKQSAADASCCCMRLQRFGDYLEHFGFAPGRELVAATHSRAVPSLPVSEPLWGQAVDGAGWGIPEAERAEADAYCATLIAQEAAPVGTSPAPLGGGAAATAVFSPSSSLPMSVAAITARLTAAYAAPTWRCSPHQCELRRVRVIFRWLCHRLTSIRLTEPPAMGDSAGAGAAAASATAAAGAAAGGGKNRQLQLSTANTTEGRRKQSKPSKNTGQNTVVVVTEDAAPPPPPDPLQAALHSRSCTPMVAARLLQAMLSAAGVACEVVQGLFKGASPEESTPWAWNCVTVGGKRYLVDVAAVVSNGFLRTSDALVVSNGSDGAAGPTAAVGAGPPSAAAPTQPAATSYGRAPPVAPAGNAAASPPQQQQQPAVVVLNLSRGPQWSEVAPGDALAQRADFYFFTDPTAFIFTHLPTDANAALLSRPPNRAVWEAAPRLAECFFSHPVRLHSHPRHCTLSVRSSPFYITVVNNRPDTTELCGAVYPCSLLALPDALSSPAAPKPLGLQWVWHQRREATGEETFTVTVPEAGYFSFVIGARCIRTDPYGCRLPAAEGGFTPIVRYQARVNFAPSATPVLPRQHLSPCVVRLLAPLAQQVQAGSHTFTVMPTCSNVLAVAVVAAKGGAVGGASPRAADTHDAKGTAAMADTMAAANSPVHMERRLLQFLPFHAAEAAYRGVVELRAGESAEVWVRYAAPDRNGRTLAEGVAIERARLPPSPPPPPPAAGGAASATRGRAASKAAIHTSSSKRGPGASTGGTAAAAAAAAEATLREAQQRELCQRLAAAEVFVPAFSGITVCRMAPAEAAGLVQPQPTVAEERDSTLRRLTGVTARLYEKAAQLEAYQPPAVGSFFTAQRGAALSSRD